METYVEKKGEDALWTWFGLSYASWLTMPRVLMHEMPDEWQAKMAVLLEEYEDAFPNQPNIIPHVSLKRDGKYTKIPRWLSNYRHPDTDTLKTFRDYDLKWEDHGF